MSWLSESCRDLLDSSQAKGQGITRSETSSQNKKEEMEGGQEARGGRQEVRKLNVSVWGTTEKLESRGLGFLDLPLLSP